ncbi:unnamed protein product [Cylindrotheca closterium]|uniref:Uncharacterized protein n=1 Tax=Cylindrotheca closterium TaxID=2856 RepID=A0AAD2PXE7_9STRA|nr:unnamed protein product [Cylindrotheca closterium]
MATTLSPTRSPTREFNHRRRLSIDAEDELFKSLKGLHEQNNSGRANRRSVDVTRAASPGNHSGRMNRRSVDGAASPGNHNGRMKRRSVDVTRAASPGNHSGRMNRRSVDGAASPGALRRQRRASLTNGRNGTKNSNISPRRNNSGRRNARSNTPPAPPGDASDSALNTQPLSLNRQTSGGSLRTAARHRRASIGVEEVPRRNNSNRSARRSAAQAEKGRTKQRSASPKPAATGAPVVRRSFNRSRTSSSDSIPSSPKSGGRNVYPTAAPSPCRSPGGRQEKTEMAMRANLLKKTIKAPNFDSSAASWDPFDDDHDDDSFFEKPNSDRTADTTKPTSERTAQSSERLESSDLNSLLQKLRDPVEMDKWKAQKEQLSARPVSGLEHEKVSEKVSSRNLKSFLGLSKRGYGAQANLDGLSVV